MEYGVAPDHEAKGGITSRVPGAGCRGGRGRCRPGFQAPQLAIAVAQGCVTPGSDGPNATLTGVVNTYYPATASIAAGNNSISVGARIAGASPAIAAGDLLLVIQMQDADINGANSIAYGDGATGHGSTALNSTGLYEYVMATSAVVGGVVTIAGSGAGNGLVNSYDFSTTVTATHGFRTFQVIRVPQYSSATLTAGLTAAAWNGAVHAGGVLAIDVAGQLNLNAQTVSVDQLGFKGALGVAQAGPVGGNTGTDYVRPSLTRRPWLQGRGRRRHAPVPVRRYRRCPGCTRAPRTATRTATRREELPGTAGGGGTDSNPAANDQNSGGGGGANGGAGRHGRRKLECASAGRRSRRCRISGHGHEGGPGRRWWRRHSQQLEPRSHRPAEPVAESS